MANYFFHPLGENGKQVTDLGTPWSTYSSIVFDTGSSFGEHGVGSLDYIIGRVPIYAMCNGIVKFVGKAGASNGNKGQNTYLCLECAATENELGKPFIIRYLHADFDPSIKQGDYITKGTYLGKAGDHGFAQGVHLHIDFKEPEGTAEYNNAYMTGKLIEEGNNYYYEYRNTRYKIKPEVNMKAVKHWQQVTGYSNDKIGYSWLVMASKMMPLEPYIEENTDTILTMGKLAVEAFATDPVARHYAHIYHTFTINGTKVRGRRDCSGLMCVILQLLGDISYNDDYLAERFCDGVVPGWKTYKMSEIGMSNLKPGDIVSRYDAPITPGVPGFTCAHVEMVVGYQNSTRIKTYAFGMDECLQASYNGTNTSPINAFGYVSRRIKSSSGGGIPVSGGQSAKIQRSVYDTYPDSSNNSNAINAYFTKSFTQAVIGPPPTTWEAFKNNDNLRCLVDFVLHEVGSWKFATAVYAKMMRASFIGSGYLWSYLPSGTYTLKSWMYGIVSRTTGWIGGWSINNGYNWTNSLTEGNPQDLKLIQAIYNNFAYPDIYGLDLPYGSVAFRDAVIRAANGLFTANGCYQSLLNLANFIVNFNVNTLVDDGKLAIFDGYHFLAYRIPGAMNAYCGNNYFV